MRKPLIKLKCNLLNLPANKLLSCRITACDLNLIMARFDKPQLQNTYSWKEGSPGCTPTFLDNDVIDTANGHDVLNFINRFFALHGLTSIESFKKLEYLLLKKPLNINTRKDITTWIRKNWDYQ